jgi:multiple antibiotic resistance protein
MDFGAAFHAETFAKFFAALFALVNPAYGIPIFLSLTDGYSPAERRKTALVVMGAVIVTGLVALLVGEEILAAFSISVPSLRIAGGIIILGIALSMMRDEGLPAGDAKAVAEGGRRAKNIAVVPLAIPLTFGPGAIVTTIIFAYQLDYAGEIATLATVVLAVAAILGVSLLFAASIAGAVGPTVISVVSRIMAIILAAVAIEMIFSGAFDALEHRYPKLPSLFAA